MAVALVILLAGCSQEPRAEPEAPETSTSTAPTPTTSAPPTNEPSVPEPSEFEADRAVAHVQHLAGRIGPRLATGAAFRRAASYVESELAASGYDVSRQEFDVPGGDSWGVPVDAGRSQNVVGTPPGFDPSRPYRLVGAHLDTIAVAPGAEDNASGIGVLLELGRILEEDQVVLVAFGAEEPVGAGDLHHFGSKHYVAEMTGEERRNLRAMVSLDRVGVGAAVPLAGFTTAATGVRDDLAQVARRERIPTVLGVSTTSDHESFFVAGMPAGRVGGADYDEYHSEADRPPVVRSAQLDRVGRLVTAWLRGR